ncbi:MAG TPA: hypothetical protein VKZ55_06900, partial [Microthrixaceae bacterium]|nr:hypothetical protein [Microthrixaceae bacterium]
MRLLPAPARRHPAALVGALLCLVAVLLAPQPPAAAQDGGGERDGAEARRVLLVTFPRLTWERLQEVQPP